MSGFVYILHSVSLNRFYIGSSGQLEARLKKHLGQHDGFTGKAKDWMQLLVEEYENKKVAFRRERKLKNWKSKDRIWQFIERCRRDLYESSPLIEPVDEME